MGEFAIVKIEVGIETPMLVTAPDVLLIQVRFPVPSVPKTRPFNPLSIGKVQVIFPATAGERISEYPDVEPCKRKAPLTSSVELGVVVPIPTRCEVSIVTAVTLLVLNA